MQPCFSFPTSGQWKAFLCILTKCKLSWPKSYLTQKRRDLDLLITSNPEGFDPFCLSFSHLLLFVSFLGKFWEAEASSRLLRLHISFFLQLTAATGVAFWKKALKETDGINTKKENCSTKNKASPLHTERDFWKWIKSMNIPYICHFFTRLKFLKNKIYIEKRQFFALNL